MLPGSSGPLRVGIDATSWSNNRGFGRFTRELVTALVARDSGVRYTLLLDRPEVEGLPAGADLLCARGRQTLEAATTGASARSPLYLWRMGRLARDAGFDLFFFPSVYAYFPLLARVPCIVCYHDTTAERFPELVFPTRRNHRLWQMKTRMARAQTARAMTISEASARDLEGILKIPRARIDLVTEAAGPAFRVIDDPSVPASARARHGLSPDGALLVHVGGMNRHKNLRRLLEAMLQIIEERADVHLALVGDVSGRGFWDDVPGLTSFVRSHSPLERHVTFTGYLDDGELAALLNGASALVFPSLWEGFGLPAVEAMSCGVPVLASRRGSLPEVVGDAGLLFEPEEPGEIAATVLNLLAHDQLRDRLAARARARASLFTWQRAAELAEASFRRTHAQATMAP